MDWWLLVGGVPIIAVLAFIVWEIASYEPPPKDTASHDPLRASWTSSAIQNDMQGSE